MSDYAAKTEIIPNRARLDYSDRSQVPVSQVDHYRDAHVEKVYSPMGSARVTRVDRAPIAIEPELRVYTIDQNKSAYESVEEAVRLVAETEGLSLAVSDREFGVYRFFEVLENYVTRQLVQPSQAARIVLVPSAIVEAETAEQLQAAITPPPSDLAKALVETQPMLVRENTEADEAVLAAVGEILPDTDAEDSLSASDSAGDEDEGD